MGIQLSFKRKIIAAAVIAVAGFAAAALVATLALGRLGRTIEESERLHSVAAAVSDAQIVLLSLGEDSRKVGAGGGEAFLERVDGEEKAALDRLEAAAGLVQTQDLEDALEAVSDLLMTYCAGLKDWVTKRAELGVNAASGRRAQLVASAGFVETAAGFYSGLSDTFYEMHSHERDFFAQNDPTYLDAFRQAAKVFKETYEKLYLGDREVVSGRTMSQLYFDYTGAMEKAAATAFEMSKLDAALGETLGALKARGVETRDRVQAISTEAETASRRARTGAITTMVAGSVAAASLLIAVLCWVGVSTGRRIVHTCDLLEDMATGDGDLTRRLPQRFASCSDLWSCEHSQCPSHGLAAPCWTHVGSMQLGSDHIQCAQLIEGQVESCEVCKVYAAARAMEVDEFDRLSHWFNTFLDRIRHLVSQVKDTSSQLASASEELSATTLQIAASGEEVSSQSQSVASAGEEMSATVQMVAGNATSVSGAAELARASASDGAAVVGEAVAAMATIAQAVEEAATTVNSLGGQAEKITVVVQVIEEIADQTNLLALNAAIEAARAGDQGRGFAVVADEVRKLAEKTVKATKEIGEMVAAIQQESRRAVSGMGQGLEAVASGRELGERAGDAIRMIEGQVVSASDETSQIASATEQLATTIREMAVNMDEIARGNQQNSASAAEIARTAEAVAGRADELRTLTGRFHT